MSTIPAKILPRLTAGIKKFQAVLTTAKAKDINESDTVVIVTDMLSEIFGFDKYSEITSEFAIKKTWCDLAIKLEEKVKFLIEVKAIGLMPKEDHIKQAVDYGSNHGVDWVILTNGIRWRIFKIIYGKPISNDLVYEFDFLTLNAKKETDVCLLYYVSKESMTKSALEEFHIQKQSLSKFFIGQILLTDSILEAIKKSIRRITPNAKLELDDIKEVLASEVVKREIYEGEKAEDAKRKINKALKALEGKKSAPMNEKSPDSA